MGTSSAGEGQGAGQCTPHDKAVGERESLHLKHSYSYKNRLRVIVTKIG